MRQHRTRIVRDVVNEHRARAAFGAITSKLGPGEAKLVPQRHRQRLLLEDVDAPHLPVHIERDETFDGSGGC